MRRQIIYRAGNSLAISIPSQLVRRMGLRPGQQAKVEIDWTTGVLKVIFPEGKQLTIKEN